MSTYDVTPDDDPLDVAAVSADDARVEQLRHALSPDAAVVWDDDDEEVDPAFALLRALQADVSADLPAHNDTILPTGVTEIAPRRRHLSRGATIAVVAASVLSIGGVAAASGPGQPLHGLRSAVSSAVFGVVHAITPDAPVGPALVEPTHAGKPSNKPSPPGITVSGAARSATAVKQIEVNLDRAAAFLDDGKYSPAKAQLDAAAKKLDYVTDAAVRDRLAARLASLRARLAATPYPKPSHGPAADKGTNGSGSVKNGSGNGNSGNSNKGGVATHSPKAAETRDPRVEPSKKSSDDGSDDARASHAPTPDSKSASGD